MPNRLRFIVDTDDPTRQRVLESYLTTASLDVSGQVRNDKLLALSIEPVKKNPEDTDYLYSPDYEATDTFEVAIGLTDQPPTSGTFKLKLLSPGGTITSSSVANPTVITFPTAHDIPNGATITIEGHTGSTPAIDGDYTATVTGANTLTIPVNVTVGGTGGLAYLTTNLTALAFDVSAASLQTPLSAAFVELSESAVTVTLLESGVYQIDATTNGAIPTGFLSGDGALLNPQATSVVIEESLGSATSKFRLLLVMRQSPMCFSEPSSALPATGVSVTTTQSGSATQNKIQKISFTAENTHGGTYRLAAVAGQQKNITSNNAANPTVITLTAHGWLTGDSITIPANNGSSPTIAGTHTITRISADTFSIPINTSAGSGGLGGLAYKLQTATAGVAKPVTTEEELASVLALHPQIYFQDADGVSDNIKVTKSHEAYFVEFIGTLGLSDAYSITATDIDLIGPQGVSGTIGLNTISLYRYSLTQEGDTFGLLLSITRNRASGERRTILGPVAITISKELPDPLTMVPTPLTSYLDRLTQLEEASEFPLSVWTAMPFSSAKLNSGAAAHLNVMLVGDSLVTDAIIQYRRLFHDHFGCAGYGFGATSAHGHAGGAAEVTGAYTYWPTGVYQNLPVGGSVKFNFNASLAVRADTIKVAYLMDAGGGTFKIQTATDGATFADEAGHTGISTANATPLGATRTIATKATPNTYTVKIVNDGGSGTVKILSVELTDSTARGVVFSAIALSGVTIAQLATTAPGVTNPVIADIAPDLVIYKNVDSAALTAANLPTLYSNIRAGFDDNDWIFLLIQQMSAQDNIAENEIIRSLAMSYDQSVHDDATWSGTYSSANALGLMSDTVHRNAAGNRIGVALMLRESPLYDAYGGDQSLLGSTKIVGSAGEVVEYRIKNSNPDATTGAITIKVEKFRNGALAVYVLDDTNAVVSGWYVIPANDGTGRGNAIAILGTGGAVCDMFMPNGNTAVGSGTLPLARLHVTGTADGTKPTAILDGASGQTGNLLELKNNTAAVLDIAPTGNTKVLMTTTAGGTTGNQTINKPSGSVNFAAAASSLVVTNNLVTTSTKILATVTTNDATMKTVAAVAAAGSFTLHANAAATGETKVDWYILNPV